MLEFANGGVASLDWAIPLAPLPEYTPTVVILHGLTGGSHESYIRGLLQIVEYHSDKGMLYMCKYIYILTCILSIRLPDHLSIIELWSIMQEVVDLLM